MQWYRDQREINILTPDINSRHGVSHHPDVSYSSDGVHLLGWSHSIRTEVLFNAYFSSCGIAVLLRSWSCCCHMGICHVCPIDQHPAKNVFDWKQAEKVSAKIWSSNAAPSFLRTVGSCDIYSIQRKHYRWITCSSPTQQTPKNSAEPNASVLSDWLVSTTV